MDFRLTDEQELLLESVRELVAREFTEDYIQQCEEQHVPPHKWNQIMAENGFGLLGIPEEYGGTPVDALTMMLVGEEFTRLGAPSLVMNMMLIDDMLAFGSEEQKKITLEYAKKGHPAFSVGISEPQAGSDNSSMAATATRRNGKVYINGHKTLISDAENRPYMLVLTKDREKPPQKSVSMWMVPNNAPGVKLERMEKIGNHLMSINDVYLDEVEVEEKDLVGEEGNGFLQLMKNFEIERLMIATNCLGYAECAFEDVARYAAQRVQFGKPIGSFQLIQKKLTDMKIKIVNMQNMIYKAAWEKDNGISVKLSAALTKLYCAQSSFEVIDDAVQILGGIGYAGGHRVSRLWKMCRANRLAGGTDEIMYHIAGRDIIKHYSK